jgi:preprotein translocase subunit SecF
MLKNSGVDITGALLIGMFSGTYSSIFVASQLLVLIQEIKAKYGKAKKD